MIRRVLRACCVDRAGSHRGRFYALRRLDPGRSRVDSRRHRAASHEHAPLAHLLDRECGVVAAPLVWFAYNALVFGDWLDFARGPYSAAAIEMRTATPGLGPPHPGWHNPWVSLLFFVKCAEMDVARRIVGQLHARPRAAGHRWGWLTTRRRGIPLDVCCCGCRFPSTRTRSHSVRCRSFFPSGGRTPGTTRAMEWRCCPPSRLDWDSSRNS